jgi:superfamily II DNA or RNA helicase
VKLQLEPELDGFGKIYARKEQLLRSRSGSTDDVLRLIAGTRLADWLDGQAEDGSGEIRIRIESEGILKVSPQTIASLNESEAALIGAPPPSALSIDISSSSQIFDPNFRLNLYHVRPGGIRVGAHRQGAFLRYDGRLWRLPEPLYSAVCAAESLAAPVDDENARMQAFAALKSALPDELQADLSDGYVRQLRLLYAGTFSLDLELSPGDVRFSPRLFAREAAGEIDDGELIDADTIALLSPHEHETFQTKAFWSRGDNPNTYKIGESSYVYVAPHLRAALNVVREVAAKPIDERRAFILNPRRVLQEKLGVENASIAAGCFIETQQFSERVTGIDVWSKPVLPWIKPFKSSWVPESFGLRVGDVDVELSREQVRELAPKIELALSEGVQTVSVAGAEIPVTAQACDAVRHLNEFLKSVPEGDGSGSRVIEDHPEKMPHPGPMFLTIRDNLDEVEYADGYPSPRDTAFEPGKLPGALRTPLKPHQIEGLGWLQSAAAYGAGAILADDMGLGKTLQCLSFLAARRDHRSGEVPRPSLIVAPTALIENWKAEIDRHFDSGAFGQLGEVTGRHLKYLKADTKSVGRDIDLGRATLDASSLAELGIVLTTYETLRDYHMSFARVPFDVVVFDEAQKTKNPTSQLTRAAKTLNARFKLALTGTPVENRLHDVWSIIDVVWSGRMGSSKEFARKYEADPSEGATALRKELMDGDAKSPPLILRRMKSGQLSDFPSKKFEVYPVEMPPEQAAAYADSVRDALATGGAARPGRMLEILQKLRSVSLHPFDPRSAVSANAYVQQSGRLIALMQILEKIHAREEKALIFVEYLDMQEFVARHIAERFGFREPLQRIHGGVPGAQRQKIVDLFQNKKSGFDALVLSPKAGGVGLNITAANHVIHLSRWWNPAVEDQATDRAYRIGQTKDVVVHIPQSIHPDSVIRHSSFDLRLDALLTRKRQLSETLLIPVDDSAFASELYEGIFNPSADRRGDTNVAADSAQIVEEVQTVPIPEPSLQPVPRPTLSLKSLVRERPEETVTHWAFGASQVRKLDEVFGFLKGKTVSFAEIRDPYALTPANRRQLDQLLAELSGRVVLIQSISVRALSANHQKVRDQMGAENNPEVIRAWKGMVRARLGAACEPNQKLVEQGGPGFHDRWVDFDIRHSGGDIKYRLHLSSGVIGLMSSRGECQVFLSPR